MNNQNFTRLVFFDIDGTLSAPGYRVYGPERLEKPVPEDSEGEIRIGMGDDTWIRYCIRNGEDSYHDCCPVPAVRDYAERKRREGAKLYVLSTSQTSFESRAKQAFIRRHYKDLFAPENVITVAADEYKLKVICALAAKYGLLPCDCELVEDTYSTLLLAEREGIRGIHVSGLAAISQEMPSP